LAGKLIRSFEAKPTPGCDRSCLGVAALVYLAASPKVKRQSFDLRIGLCLASWWLSCFALSTSGQFPIPPNDNVGAAETIVEAKTFSRTLASASTELNEPEPERPSVWFSWTAPESGIARLRLSRNLGVAGWSVHVFAGETWQQEIRRVSATTGTVVELEFDTAIGGKYLLAVKSDASAVGSFQLLLMAGAPVPNDSFADRIPLAGTNLTVEVALEMATKESDEWGTLDLIAVRSAWYEWAPPVAGELRLQTQAVGKETNRWTGNGIYAGWSTPVDLGSLRPIRPNWTELTAIRHQGWKVDPSTNYAIAVDTISSTGSSAVTGPMEVRMVLNFAPHPENDSFEKRIVVEGERFRIRGTLDAARPDLIGTRRTVWYEWKAPSVGSVSVGVIEPSGVSVAIFEVVNGDTLVAVSSPSPSSAPVFFQAMAGKNYAFAFHSAADGAGRPFEARIDMSGPKNDNFVERIPLDGVHATFSIMTFRASVETNEPPDLRNSTWWTWTAPYSGWATLRSEIVSFSVYTGASLESLEAVPVERLDKFAMRIPTSVTGFDCTAGVTYQIAAHRVSQLLRDAAGELDLTSLRFTHPVGGSPVKARERVRIQMAPIDPVIDGVLNLPVVFVRADSVYKDSVVESAGDPPSFSTAFVDTGYEDGYGPRKYYAFTTNQAGVLKVSKPLRIELLLENDHFAEATPVVIGPWLHRTTYGKATLESREAELLGISDLPLVSRWWRSDPARDSEMEFLVSGNSGTLFLGVFRGSGFESLEAVTKFFGGLVLSRWKRLRTS
jgi:hypothetical protein